RRHVRRPQQGQTVTSARARTSRQFRLFFQGFQGFLAIPLVASPGLSVAIPQTGARNVSQTESGTPQAILTLPQPWQLLTAAGRRATAVAPPNPLRWLTGTALSGP